MNIINDYKIWYLLFTISYLILHCFYKNDESLNIFFKIYSL